MAGNSHVAKGSTQGAGALELTQPQFVLLHACLWLNEHDEEGKGVTQVQIAQFAKVDVNVTSQVLRALEKGD